MTGISVGMALLALGFVVDLLTRGRGRPWQAVAWVAAVAASMVMAVTGARALGGGAESASLGWLFGQFGPAAPQTGLVLDRLGGLFLLIVFAVAVPALLVVAAWSTEAGSMRSLPAAVCLLLASCAAIVLAGDAFVLAFSWELLTASFYWLTLPGRQRRGSEGSVTASLATVTFGKVSGAALLLGLLLLAGSSGSLSLAHLGDGPHGAARVAGYALLVVAFAVKVGLVPLQVWMPRGYSAAPGPARALMAGAAVNVGFYGLWRTLDVLGRPPGLLAVVVLSLGGLTALLGVAHATVQTRLTAIIAYSSIENAGLIVTAYGIALIGAVTGQDELVAAGLLAATLQVVAHAVAKTLLFASAGVIESRLGTDDIDLLRGVARRLPWSGTGLAVGSVTLAGLPPTVMFVSEWFILETLMQQFRIGQLSYALPMAAAGALVALTTGFAGVAFVRLAAFTALGRSGGTPRNGSDVGLVGRVGLGALMLACPGLAVAAPAEIHVLAAGLAGIVPSATIDGAVPSPWVLGPVYTGFSALSPTWLAIELPVVLLVVLVVSVWLSRGRMLRVRRVEAWRSATGGVDGADEYTPFGYANPTRKVLANVLLTRTELRTVERAGGGRVGDEGSSPAGAHLGYASDVVEVTEALLYRPVLRPLRWSVTTARRLQSGRLDAYLLYMLIALVAVLAIAVG